MDIGAMERFKRATQNLKDGNYENALNDFKLLHDNPDDQSYDYLRLRRGHALAAWIVMGRDMYPEAISELEKVLESKIKRRTNGDKDPLLEGDIVAIQKYLKELIW